MARERYIRNLDRHPNALTTADLEAATELPITDDIHTFRWHDGEEWKRIVSAPHLWLRVPKELF